MNTPNTQILVSNTILQQRDLTVFWRNGCSRTRGGSIENERRDSCNATKNESAKKKKKEKTHKDWGKVKGTQEPM